MKWYLKVIKNYAGFSGRASREEYWMYTLFTIIFGVLAMIADNACHTTFGILPYGLFYFIYILAVFVPGLAVAVRRLHDTGRSGFSFLLVLIPFVGAIIVLVYTLTEGNPGPNKYGPDPNEETTEANVIS